MIATPCKPVSTVIVDDDKEAIFALQNYLELMPEVKCLGSATTWQKGLKLIREQNPDLLFLDIEMPGKTGFELLREYDMAGHPRRFHVIFHTAYDNYTLQALREAAFDFILKPPKEEEVRTAIQRYLKQRPANPAIISKAPMQAINHMVGLPTITGLQFIQKSDIVKIECQRSSMSLRPNWTVTLNNHQTIRLRPNTTAGSIIEHLGADQFILINQSVIVNITYMSMIEYKTNRCYLYPPFDQTPLKISRGNIALMKVKFDVI